MDSVGSHEDARNDSNSTPSPVTMTDILTDKFEADAAALYSKAWSYTGHADKRKIERGWRSMIHFASECGVSHEAGFRHTREEYTEAVQQCRRNIIGNFFGDILTQLMVVCPYCNIPFGLKMSVPQRRSIDFAHYPHTDKTTELIIERSTAGMFRSNPPWEPGFWEELANLMAMHKACHIAMDHEHSTCAPGCTGFSGAKVAVTE
jgi:hypothetical protein